MIQSVKKLSDVYLQDPLHADLSRLLPERQVAGRGVFEPVTIAAAAVVIRLPGGTRIEVPAHSECGLRVIVSQLAGDDTEAAPC